MKVLIIRFSSIGDIVLTTPVIRALATSEQEIIVHYATKKKFKNVIINNPYIDKIFAIDKNISEIEDELKTENYDYIIDLHRNLRSRMLISKLGVTHKYFNKLNYEKWLKVHLKVDILPAEHIVERYMDTISFMNIKYDGKGLDYFLAAEDEDIFNDIEIDKNENYNVFVVGGAHKTKQIPMEKLIEIGKLSKNKVVLLGGADDIANANNIQKQIGKNCIDLSGKLTLNQSATVVKYSQKVLTADTGLMHIAAAFKREVLAIWGNTIPEFGMWALLPKGEQEKNYNFEVAGLKCRPCSKIGYEKCPKKHFDCMLKQDIGEIVGVLNE